MARGRGRRRRVDGTAGRIFPRNILSLEAASQKLGVALALRPLVDDDIKSGRLCARFKVELKPQSAYYLVCPEVIRRTPGSRRVSQMASGAGSQSVGGTLGALISSSSIIALSSAVTSGSMPNHAFQAGRP